MRVRLVIGLFAICFLIGGNAYAAPNSAKPGTQSLIANLPAPQIEATAWALMEVSTGWVAAGNNQHQPLPPASITKLMSNYVVFDLLDKGLLSFDDQVSISESAWRAEGSRMFANVNSKVELKHLLKSTIIQSGNDAAIALAEHAGGSELAFAQLMNQAAEKLGLENSHFENSTGLPAQGHTMSAVDIARLSAAIIEQHPDYYAWYSEKQYTHNEITQYNRNRLLWRDDSIDGLKTGHTEAAGFCLVGTAERRGLRWIAVVLGASGEQAREDAVMSLLNYGFAAFRPVSVLDAQGGVMEVDVYHGEADSIRLQAASSAKVLVPTGQEKDIQIQYQLSPYYQAPISMGQAMGVASLSIDNQPLADIPLVAMSDIVEGNWWKRLKDSIRLRIREFRNN